MRAVLKEELGDTDRRLMGRMTEVEHGFDNLQDEFKGLERRMDAMERRLDKDKDKSIGAESFMMGRTCP